MNTDLIKQDNNFYSYQTKDFSTILIEHIFSIEKSPKSHVIARALCSYLMKTNNIYKTEKEIQDKSRSLYCANFEAYVSDHGTKTFICIYFKMIDQKIIGEDTFNDTLNYFKDMLYKPNFENNKLDKQVLDEIKKDMLSSLQRVEKNPEKFQNTLFYRHLLPNSDFSFNKPYSEELKNILDEITDKDIIDLYNSILKRHIATLTFGNLTDEENQHIKECFPFQSIPFDYTYYHKEEITNDYKIIKSNDTSQSYLYVAYEIKDFKEENSPIYYAMLPMFNSFKGLCHSILRDKLGLVYNSYASFLHKRGIFYICAHIDKKNTDKALAGIDEIIQHMLDKSFIKEELEFAKEKYKQELYFDTESLNAQFTNLKTYILKHKMLKKDLVDKINSLTVDDIINQVKNFEKKYTFLYEGDKDEK